MPATLVTVLARSRMLLAVTGALAALACGCGGAGTGAPPKPGKVRFARQLEGAVVPGPALAPDGSVLAASNGGVLHALNPTDGRDRWRFDGGETYGTDLSTTPLVLPHRRLILWPGPRDTVYGLDLRGRLRFSRPFAAPILTPARGPGRTVYVEEATGVLHALTVGASSVRERWRLRVGDGTSYGSPAVAPDGTVYTTVGRDLVAVRDRGSSGSVRWRFSARADVEVSPAVAPDGTVVLGTNDAFQYGVSPAGRERWRFRREIFTYSSPLATPDGRVRFGDHRGRLITLDARTGRVAQIIRARGQVWTRPAVDRAGNVFFGTHAGEVFGYDRTGRRIVRVRTGGSVESYPVVGADGTVYIGSEDGRLYAIGPAQP